MLFFTWLWRHDVRVAELKDLSWAKTAWGQVLDFATFVGPHWRWVALAVAAWYGGRFLYDSHLISVWRAGGAGDDRLVLTFNDAGGSFPSQTINTTVVGRRLILARQLHQQQRRGGTQRRNPP